MALKTNTASGQADGTVATTGNTGGASGDAFNAVTGGGGSLEFESTNAYKQGMCYKVVMAASLSRWFSWTGYNNTILRVRFYFRFEGSVPTDASHTICDILNAAGTFSQLRAFLNASSQIVLRTNNGVTTLKTFTTAIAANTWYRLELVAGSGTSNVTQKCDLYVGDSTTPVETGFSTTTGTSGTTDNIDQVRFGKTAANAFAGTLLIDDLAAQEGSTTYLGPSNAPPVAVAPVNSTVQSYETVVLDGSASSDEDGTIASYLWAQIGGTPTVTINNSTSAVANFKANGVLSDSSITIRLTVTDDDGASATDDVIITILAATRRSIKSGAQVPVEHIAVHS